MRERKPFFLKTKILYQTKLNLWEKDSHNLEILTKKKWDFLKFQLRRKNSKISTFRFTPFSFNEFNLRVKMNFKNNLYLRKLVRLKQGRLKNKEFYNIFKKSTNYRSLLSQLGSRLDVVLYNFLAPSMIIFELRQKILHEKILLNGLKVKSPSIQLKPFDVISFRFSDLGFSSRFHMARLALLSYYCLHFIVVKSNYSLLSTEGKRELIKDFLEHGLSVNSSHSKFDLLVDFYLDSFNRYSRKNLKKQNKIEKIIYQVNDNKTNKKFYKNTKLNLKKSLEFYKETFFKLDVEYFMTPLLTKIHFQKNNIFFNEFEEFLGFFSNNFRGDSLEININGDYIDIVFLGFFDEDVYINSNRKYLLHYLY